MSLARGARLTAFGGDPFLGIVLEFEFLSRKIASKHQ